MRIKHFLSSMSEFNSLSNDSFTQIPIFPKTCRNGNPAKKLSINNEQKNSTTETPLYDHE